MFGTSMVLACLVSCRSPSLLSCSVGIQLEFTIKLQIYTYISEPPTSQIRPYFYKYLSTSTKHGILSVNKDEINVIRRRGV